MIRSKHENTGNTQGAEPAPDFSEILKDPSIEDLILDARATIRQARREGTVTQSKYLDPAYFDGLIASVQNEDLEPADAAVVSLYSAYPNNLQLHEAMSERADEIVDAARLHNRSRKSILRSRRQRVPTREEAADIALQQELIVRTTFFSEAQNAPLKPHTNEEQPDDAGWAPLIESTTVGPVLSPDEPAETHPEASTVEPQPPQTGTEEAEPADNPFPDGDAYPGNLQKSSQNEVQDGPHPGDTPLEPVSATQETADKPSDRVNNIAAQYTKLYLVGLEHGFTGDDIADRLAIRIQEAIDANELTKAEAHLLPGIIQDIIAQRANETDVFPVIEHEESEHSLAGQPGTIAMLNAIRKQRGANKDSRISNRAKDRITTNTKKIEDKEARRKELLAAREAREAQYKSKKRRSNRALVASSVLLGSSLVSMGVEKFAHYQGNSLGRRAVEFMADPKTAYIAGAAAAAIALKRGFDITRITVLKGKEYFQQKVKNKAEDNVKSDIALVETINTKRSTSRGEQ